MGFFYPSPLFEHIGVANPLLSAFRQSPPMHIYLMDARLTKL